MKINKSIIIVIVISVLAGGIGGYFISSSSNQQINSSEYQNSEESADQIWTCSMHPSVRQNEPGDCPICGMDLIPVDESNNTDVLSPDAVSMSSTSMELAQVSIAKVERKSIEKDIRVTGKIQANEKQSYSLSAHFPGRIEDLRLNFTGEYVQKGEVIAALYSPELLTAQEELLQAYKDREIQPSLFKASKEKLKNWKLNDAQIEKIISLGKPQEQFEIIADYSGYVIEKKVKEGDYVRKGQSLFQLNNLSRIWVFFDVYEQDIPFVKLGSKVDFKIAAFPNQEFSAKIDFINPSLNPQSRTTEARAEIQNHNGKLKPEMLLSGQIIYQDQSKLALIVPKSAVMWTGKRSVVYVQENTDMGISFVMREVDLGLSLNDEYVIESGLAEGEEIAVHGAFSIDAAAQLAGKPSMMSAQSQSESSFEISGEAKSELRPLYEVYFELKDQLTEDDFESAISKAKELKSVFQKIDMKAFQDDTHEKWMEYHVQMEKVLEDIEAHNDIQSLRKNFIALSDWMIDITETFEPIEEKIYLQNCPMADNDKGADWLSREQEIVNPYFGASMLKCGEVEKVFN